MPGLGVRFRLERVFYSVGVLTWQHGVLSRKLRGHYSFYGITGNSVAITRFRHEVRSRWRKWLSRRGGRSPMSWPQFHRLEERHLLPAAIAVHSSSRRAANRTHELRSRMRESCTSGSVGAPGGRLPGATRLLRPLRNKCARGAEPPQERALARPARGLPHRIEAVARHGDARVEALPRARELGPADPAHRGGEDDVGEITAPLRSEEHTSELQSLR